MIAVDMNQNKKMIQSLDNLQIYDEAIRQNKCER